MFQPQKKLNELLPIQSPGQAYLNQTRSLLGSIALPGADVRVMSGAFEEIEGLALPEGHVTLLDVRIKPGGTFAIRANRQETICLYLIEGGAKVEDTVYETNSAASYTGRDSICITAQGTGHARLIYLCGKPTPALASWRPQPARECVAG